MSEAAISSDNCVEYKVTSLRECEAILGYLKAHGWTYSQEPKWWLENYPYLCFLPGPKWVDGNSHPRHHAITIQRVFGLVDYEAPPLPVSVKLNDGNMALVYASRIEVGCQTFPISIIDELVAARATMQAGGAK